MVETILKGMIVSGTLIVAIGAQNAFVLKQGLRKNHIFYVSLIAFLCDFVLMSVGVMGMGNWIKESHTLTNLLALGGALFLFYYGVTLFVSSYRGTSSMELSSDNAANEQGSLSRVITQTLAVTLLNPHVYLDTVVIIGGISGTLNSDEKVLFLIGAWVASFAWFFSLGYGSRLLIPLFEKKITWRIFDFVIGCVMFFIAIGLVRYVLEN